MLKLMRVKKYFYNDCKICERKHFIVLKRFAILKRNAFFCVKIKVKIEMFYLFKNGIFFFVHSTHLLFYLQFYA